MAGEANMISKVSIARVKSIVASVMGGVLEAPIDGQQYARQNGAWAVVIGGGGGSGDMILANAQTVTGAKTFNSGTLLMRNAANTISSQFSNTNTAPRTYTLPNESGTVALRSNLGGFLTGIYTGSQRVKGTGSTQFELYGADVDTQNTGGISLSPLSAVIGWIDHTTQNTVKLEFSETDGALLTDEILNRGLTGATNYSANYLPNTYVQKVYVDNQFWNRASGVTLTAANTISGAFNIGFTNNAVGFGVAPGFITVNTKVDIRGLGTSSASSSLRVASSTNVPLFRIRDDGAIFHGPNEQGLFFDETGTSIYRPVTSSFTRIANDGTVGAQILFYGSTHATNPNHCEIYAALTSVFNGKLVAAASVTGYASIRLPHGTAPTTPENGDMWTTTAGLFVRINGVTVGPLT